MAQYKIVYTFANGREVEEGPYRNYPATPDGIKLKKAKVVVILRDSEGEDHPDNAGKFFLHRIVK